MNFEVDVINKSFEKPVVVDFWAEWCGPCRVLGPVIEDLAEEQNEKWELVKVDTEENYDLAVKYRIQSIPNVKMFYQGEVIAEFQGALPKTQIQKWLDLYLPKEETAETDETTALLEALNKGNVTPALIEELGQRLIANPERIDIRVALARYILFRQPDEASKLVAGIKIGDEHYEAAEDIKVLIELVNTDFVEDVKVAGLLEEAKKAFQDSATEKGIQLLIEAVTIDKSYFDELPRKATIALFRLLGPQNELTKNYRWRFDMALY